MVMLAGETLLERAVRTAWDAGLDPVVVVVNAALRDAAEPVVGRLQTRGCMLVVNLDAAEGMASSIRVGVEALGALMVDGAVVLTCDQVALTADHLRMLCAEPSQVAASGFAGKAGVPAYFPAGRFAALSGLVGDQGARPLLAEARVVTAEALALDVDTEEELRRAVEWVEEQAR